VGVALEGLPQLCVDSSTEVNQTPPNLRCTKGGVVNPGAGRSIAG